MEVQGKQFKALSNSPAFAINSFIDGENKFFLEYIYEHIKFSEWYEALLKFESEKTELRGHLQNESVYDDETFYLQLSM
jgi:hypothetical protein